MLLDSDVFIAIIKEEDRLKQPSLKILKAVEKRKLKNAYASVASIQEIIFWLLNRNLRDKILLTVSRIFELKNLEWIPLTKEIFLTASALIEEYKLGAFDAYMAATALSKDRIIVSSDHIYDKIKGIKRISLEEIAKRL